MTGRVRRRIGLLTLPLEINYGGIMQAVALYHFLSSNQDREVVLLEREPPFPRPGRIRRLASAALRRQPGLTSLHRLLAEQPQGSGWAARLCSCRPARWLHGRVRVALWRRRRELLRSFHQRLIPLRSGPLADTQDMAEAVRRFGIDTLIVGSDQVWRLDYLHEAARADFFFGFAPSPTVRKISYAASFGHGHWAFPEHTAQIKPLLARFDAVSVREASGVEICAREFGRHDARHVLDPTLLIDPSFYETIAAPAGRKSGKTLLSYVLDTGADPSLVSCELLAALGPDYAVRPLTLDVGTPAPDVPGWLRAFMDADFVVTDSFHGMVFSIIFRKNFIAVMNRNRGAERFTSLLDQLGLRDRLVGDPAPDLLHRLARTPIDFEPVARKLEELRAASAAFLRQALA